MKAVLYSLFLFPVVAFGASGDIDSSVARLDKAVASALSSESTEMNPKASDSVWVRRVYLDLVGRIPSADEAARYIDSEAPGKRDALITELLDSPGRASHDFSFWADVLRVPSRVSGQNGAAVMGKYIDWLREQFSENVPYDELVTSLVTAEGYVGENPAVGFTLRDRGMPLDHMSATVEIFLGTQMLCAQCHDHPYAEWTQQDFYRLAAFSYGMKDVRTPKGIEDRMKMASKDVPKAKRRKLGKQVRSLFAPLKDAMVEEVPRKLKLPDDYQYEDGEPGELVMPEVPFGPDSGLDPGVSKVHAYADWMTSQENLRFAKVGANRLWKRLFGVGVLEPITDFDQEDEAFSGELLDFLGELFVSLDYDMRALTRVLANSDLYSRTAMPIADVKDYSFAGPGLRRMTAEQAWDSMVTLVQKEPDLVRPSKKRYGGGGLVDNETYLKLKALDGDQIERRLEQLVKLEERSVKELKVIRAKLESMVAKKRDGDAIARNEVDELAAELSKTTEEIFGKYAELAMIGSASDVGRMNNPLVNGPRQLAKTMASNFPRTRAILSRSFPQYQNKKNQKRMAKNKKGIRERMREIQRSEGKEAADAFLKETREVAESRTNQRFVRAAWLPQPAPEGHFLRTFGQSDREASMNGNTEATVPQALALMNGRIFPSLLNPAAKIRKAFDAAPDVSAKADAIYLAVLARRPDAEERALVEERLESKDRKAAEGVLWALMNSPQFLFIE
ncbi:DUF1549 domain-containing protein [Verrucomicrobiales bacterium]|nr:DUF1549 domain-containing protein [Verrucomicrobiales bacterium]